MVDTSTLMLVYYELSVICMLLFFYGFDDPYDYKESENHLEDFFYYFDLTSVQKCLYVIRWRSLYLG